MRPEELRILLIEDDRYHAVLVEKALMFSHLNCTVDKAFSAAEGLQRLSEKQYDLLLLDYGLPDSNGLIAIKEIKARGFRKPIIITTGEGNEKIAVEFMKSEVCEYIVKDEQYPRIVPYVISQVLEKDRLRRKNEELESRALETEKISAVVKTIRTLNHEINNPLMTVLGNAQLLRTPKYELSKPAGEKVRMIEESALRIQEITKELANVVRLQWRQTPNGDIIDIENSTRHSEVSQVSSGEASRDEGVASPAPPS
jgi:CheY-like chemotaxis protein